MGPVSNGHLSVLRVYHSAVVTAWRGREEALRRNDIEVTTVAPRRWDEGGEDVPLETAAGEPVVGVRTFGRHPFRFLYEPFGLLRVLRRLRPAVLDIHEEPASLAAIEVYVLARLLGLRPTFCLYSAQNLPKRYPPPFRWWERFLLRRAAAVHTCNDAAGQVLRGKGFSGSVVNLGLGLDLARYDPLTQARAAVDSSGTEDPLRVGYVGRLTDQKGVAVLLRALPAVPSARLTIVGGGPAEATLRELVSDLSLGERVELIGHVPAVDLPARLGELDVVVVPSLDTPGVVEQFGRVVVEAQAAGAAVVVSDSGELANVGGDAALVVPQGDVAALAAALSRLAEDREELRHRQLAGPAQAARYSWDAIGARQAALYAAMAGPSGGGRHASQVTLASSDTAVSK